MFCSLGCLRNDIYMNLQYTQFTEDGTSLCGEVAGDYLMLEEADWQQVGPLSYSLQIGRRGAGEARIWAAGSLALPVRAVCVRCLQPFDIVIRSEGYAYECEAAGSVVDLTPSIREEIVLNLPVYPDCAEDGDRQCSGVKIPQHLAGNEPSAQPDPDQRWAGLSRLGLSGLSSSGADSSGVEELEGNQSDDGPP